MNLFDVYPLYPIEPVRGKGNYVYDADGQEYLDLYGGHAVISIGHAHPHYVDAIAKQVAALGFYSNSVENSLQKEFAMRLGKACGYEDYSFLWRQPTILRLSLRSTALQMWNLLL